MTKYIGELRSQESLITYHGTMIRKQSPENKYQLSAVGLTPMTKYIGELRSQSHESRIMEHVSKDIYEKYGIHN